MSNKKEEILSLWAELFVAHPLAIRKVEEIMKGRAPLGLDEYDLLLVISREPNHKCRFSTLAEKTLYTKSGVTRVAKRMLEKGYLIKEECSEDKRGAYAKLTAEGIQALKETWVEYSRAIVKVLDPCFEIDKTIQLRQLLGELVEGLREDALVRIMKKTVDSRSG